LVTPKLHGVVLLCGHSPQPGDGVTQTPYQVITMNIRNICTFWHFKYEVPNIAICISFKSVSNILLIMGYGSVDDSSCQTSRTTDFI
jgi:hypothetical protein